MSFRDCIISAAESGRITAAKRDEALAAFDTTHDSLLRNGTPPDVAANAAAHEALKATTALKAAERRARIAQMQKEHTILERIGATEKPGELAQELAEESFLHYDNMKGVLAGELSSILDKYMPKVFGIRQTVENMDNVVISAYGGKTNPEADAFAKAVKEYYEFEAKTLNSEGATIPTSADNFRMSQRLDSNKVFEAGEEEFVRTYMQGDFLDWEEMRYHGKKIPEDMKEQLLRQSWETIALRGWNKEAAGQAAGMSLVNRLNQERFFRYKTGESWLEANKKFGDGDLYHQLVSDIDSAARSYGLMRVFGPNPNTGKAFVERAARNRAGAIKLTMRDKPKKAAAFEAKINSDLVSFDEMYKIQARDVDAAAGDAVANFVGTARNISSAAALGSAVISNLSDVAYAMISRNMMGLPALQVIPRYFSALGNSKKITQEAIDLGILLETSVQRAYEGNVHNLAEYGSAWSRHVGEVSYRFQGAQSINQTGREVAGIELAQIFARMRNTEFDKLPFVQQLRTLGISKEDWDLFRTETQLHEPQYYKFGKGQMLRPIDALRNASGTRAEEAAKKFMLFQSYYINNGIPTASLRARQFFGGAQPNSQFRTQIMKTMTQLMLFPASVHFQYWNKIWQMPRVRDKLWMGGKFLGYTLLSGAMVTQIKDLLNGKEPHPMNTKAFWARAFLNGGAGGIVGDMLFDGALSLTKYGAMTPLGQQSDNIVRLADDVKRQLIDGEDRPIAADAARLVWGLFPKPPGVKLVVERTIMDGILEDSDPAAYARKIRAQQEWEQDQGQGFWWGTGD